MKLIDCSITTPVLTQKKIETKKFQKSDKILKDSINRTVSIATWNEVALNNSHFKLEMLLLEMAWLQIDTYPWSISDSLDY